MKNCQKNAKLMITWVGQDPSFFSFLHGFCFVIYSLVLEKSKKKKHSEKKQKTREKKIVRKNRKKRTRKKEKKTRVKNTVFAVIKSSKNTCQEKNFRKKYAISEKWFEKTAQEKKYRL